MKMSLRLKYQLKALFRPACWLRGSYRNKYSEEWDRELWDNLENGRVEYIGSYCAIIGRKKVWIENHPYASGTWSTTGDLMNEVFCSRATALFMADVLKKHMIFQVLTGPHEHDVHEFAKYGC